MIKPELAHAEYWLNVINTQIILYFYRFLTAIRLSEQQTTSEKMLEGLTLFSEGISEVGLYFSSSVIGPIDLAFIPFALRPVATNTY